MNTPTNHLGETLERIATALEGIERTLRAEGAARRMEDFEQIDVRLPRPGKARGGEQTR